MQGRGAEENRAAVTTLVYGLLELTIISSWLSSGDMNALEGETKFTDKIDRRATEEEVTNVLEKLQGCYESICGEISTSQLYAVEVENHLERNPELSESKRKHLIQQSSIIGHLVSVNLLNNDPSVCIFELGAGKAQLAYWMAKRAPRAKFLLIDRSGSRNKYDNKALQRRGGTTLWLSAAPPEAAGNHDLSVFFRLSAQQARCFDAADNQSFPRRCPAPCLRPFGVRCRYSTFRPSESTSFKEDPSLDIKRLRCSIEHVDLSKVEMLKDVSGLCAVCKHFCGSATDAGVRCLANGIAGGLLLEGFVLVPCCHHKSRYREYCGREFLAEWGMDSEGDFAALRLIASWAVSGITLKRNGEEASDGDVLAPVTSGQGSDGGINVNKQISSGSQQQCGDTSLPWSPQWKEEMGRRAKIIFETGRARHLAKLGFTTRVVKYVPESVSPENLLILGVKNSSN
ncbi:hypothetical protein Y032_0046g1343 [Ancylostoma ceylanicum]|uniref:tRNA:m(4)X modification enzyme TRM13 n=1 Tax=Ancylostoma ceylanicum TaxID=53326 RepID=A0A016UCI8_9BILA|nr:hypothetical protein Y032_0046g1343 [Ancylostoma ceylanicum]